MKRKHCGGSRFKSQYGTMFSHQKREKRKESFRGLECFLSGFCLSGIFPELSGGLFFVFYFLFLFVSGSQVMACSLNFASFDNVFPDLIVIICPVQLGFSDLSCIYDYLEYYDLLLNCFPWIFFIFIFILTWSDNNHTSKKCIFFSYCVFFLLSPDRSLYVPYLLASSFILVQMNLLIPNL